MDLLLEGKTMEVQRKVYDSRNEEVVRKSAL